MRSKPNPPKFPLLLNTVAPREGRAGRGLGRGVCDLSTDAIEIPLSLTLSPLLRRRERELGVASVVPAGCADAHPPGNRVLDKMAPRYYDCA